MSEQPTLQFLVDLIKNVHKEMIECFDTVDQRFEDIDQKFISIDQRFDAIDQKFISIGQRLNIIDQRLDSHDRHFLSLERKLNFLEDSLFDFQMEEEKNHSYTHKLLNQLSNNVSGHETRIQTLEVKI